MPAEVVRMYLTHSLWDEARKIADRTMVPDQVRILCRRHRIDTRVSRMSNVWHLFSCSH
jgi:hypothetical protein